MKKYCFIIIFFILFIILANINTNKITSFNESINVEVKGELFNPGVFELKRDSTFSDLVNLLKLSDNSDLSNISLTSVLYNNQIIIIPKVETNINKISINSATIDELCLLPGIGETIAKRIIEYRQTYGSFNSLEEIKNVKGIGNSKYEKIVEYICL